MGTRTTVTFSGLPTDGSQLYVRLGTRFDSGWQYSDTSYRTADNRAPNSSAAMTSPQPGATLPGATASFAWTLPRDASEVFLYVGNSAGANDLWGGSLGTRTNVTFSGLPTDGRSIWLRLWTRTQSGWVFADYNYRAARQ